jgi:hypothetical protein
MSDMKAENQNKVVKQGTQQDQDSQSTVIQSGERHGGSDVPALFSLNPGGFSNTGPFDQCWWIRAPHMAQ